jgi:ribonucleoside-diphosphate reductase alpha chain
MPPVAAPYWLTDDTRTFMARGYLRPGDTPESRMRRIADAAGDHTPTLGFADKFHAYLSRGWYSLASPVWSNFGTDRGLPISCNGSYVPDDTAEILRKVAEVGVMTKHGAGTAAYFGAVRARGSAIRDGGTAYGPVHFMELFDKVATVISQGSTRRGAFAAYLPIDHPDVGEFLRCRSEGHPVQHISLGLVVPDAWMESMVGGDKPKQEVWAAVVRKRLETGYPYLFFVDAANRAVPAAYKTHGLRIESSNLCVTGDQRVVSDRGLKTARQLCEEGGDLTLFDNVSAVRSSPMRLIEKDAEVFRVTLDNGMTHTVTGYHKMPVRVTRWVVEDRACSDLKPGDLVAVQTQKGVFGKTHMPQEAFLLGLYEGDGTQTDKLVAIDLWENNFDLLDEVQGAFGEVCQRHQLCISTDGCRHPTAKFTECHVGASPVRKRRLISTSLKKFGFEKGVIPAWVWEGDEATQWQYIRGLLYTDGTVHVGTSAGNPLQLSLASVKHKFLGEVQILLANLGVKTTIRKLKDAGMVLLPDGKGGRKEYECQKCWRLIVGNKPDALTVEKYTGFLTRKGVLLEDRDYQDNTKKYYAVVSVEPAGREDVYCCTVDSERHHWVCNGVVTRNCSEISLSSAADTSFVCCLSSMNLLHYDEWKDTDAVRVLAWVLDAVMQEYIDKARRVPALADAVRFAESQRAVGLGTLGYHSALQAKGIPFESLQARALNVQMHRRVQEEAHAANREMGAALGEPELLRGTGLRCATMTAIAPTTSSSFILGQVSPSIEPLNSNYFVKDLEKGRFTYRNPHLQALLAEKGQDTPETWRSVLMAGGSVAGLACLTDKEKAVFRTFGEISQREVVDQAAARQPYVDQAQSLNIMAHPKTPARDVSDLMIHAWRSGLKSLYYHKGTNAAQALARSLNECAVCEA